MRAFWSMAIRQRFLRHFKWQGTFFDQGSSMLYGFGERGFNTHRFDMNYLEAPIDVIRHEMHHTVHFKGKAIRFRSDA